MTDQKKTETPRKTRTIEEGDDGQRLDRWLQQTFPHLTYAFIQKAMRTGDIRLDGKKVEGKERLATGQEVRLPPAFLHAPVAGAPRPLTQAESDQAAQLLVYEDRALVALDKPHGLATQGGSKVFNHVDRLLQAYAGADAVRPKLVHRLDKDTSGIMVAARHREAAATLGHAFKHREVRKTYLALTLGVPRSYQDRINRPLLKTATPDGEKVVVDREGKDAVTLYSVLSFSGKEVALVALRPETGRMHQLRAHLAHIHAPILGDRKYGGMIREGRLAEAANERLWLHALYLHLPHPETGKELDLFSPVPERMAYWLEQWNMEVMGLTDTRRPMDPMESMETVLQV